MPLLHDVTRRRRQPEIIDQPDLDAGAHARALVGLERINWWSGSAGILWRPIARLARSTGRRLRVLDLATGAGDVPIRLWRKARWLGVPLEIAGCDRSDTAVGFARNRATGTDVTFFTHDALAQDLPPGFDVVTCSLFLHHLDEGAAVVLLRRMARAARHLVLVNDLVRSRAGYALAYVGTRVLSGSPVVHTDGPRSVEGAFTVAEAMQLALEAGLAGATVRRRWPCRFLLQWQRPIDSLGS